jgi:iron complex transport system substrate-binding protein
MLRVWPLFLSLLLLQFSLTFPVKATTLWPKQAPSRIVSLSPHITETLFALGAGSQVIAVTRYCDYPSEAIALPNVGGLLDVNIEAIVALKADLVILLSSQQSIQHQLNTLGISTLAVDSRTLNDIQSTIRAVGLATGHQQKATQLLTQMTEQIAAITLAVEPLTKPTVMISVSHSLGDNALHSVYIAGQQDFYNDLLQIAGGENVYQRAYPKVPHISLEGILNLNPDVIIDIFPEADDHSASLDVTYAQWMTLTSVKAVQNKQVHLIQADYATIPGPRVITLLKQLVSVLHPELGSLK